MILNSKKDLAASPICINIGKVKVQAESNAKLLGIHLDDNQKWKSQIQHTINSLNTRLYLLRRMAKAISKDRLKKSVIAYIPPKLGMEYSCLARSEQGN